MRVTTHVTVQGFIGKIEGDILFELFFAVFVEDALIVEIRNIKKRFLRDFLTFFDRLEISNGYSYTLQGVLWQRLKRRTTLLKVLDEVIEVVVVSGCANLGIVS